MGILQKARELDTLAKVAIVNIIIVAFYILLICFVVPLILEGRFSEEYVLSFSEPLHRHANLLSILAALIFGAVCVVLLSRREEKSREEKDTMHIVKSVLSQADREVLDIVDEAGEITQDSLKFRLGWSRSKLSTILTNLEKRNLVQRRREGKTYVVFVPSALKGALKGM